MDKVLYTIGEALIDFIPQTKGTSLKDVLHFERAAGGAPANVAAAVAKLGLRSAMVTKLGIDPFGDYLVETLQQSGVDTRYIFRTKEANTALAFVSLTQEGERDFCFFRNPSADMLLDEKDIEKIDLADIGALHFCSVDLLDAPVKSAHKKMIEKAKQKGAIISFDLNIRLPLWDSEDACRRAVLEFLPYADIVKLSDDELTFLTGNSDIQSGLPLLLSSNCKLILLTRGAAGSELITHQYSLHCSAVPVQAVDTTGAGDSFIGAFLSSLLRDQISLGQLSSLDCKVLERYLHFSSLYAAHTVTKKGAISAMASLEEIKAFAAETR